MKRETILYGEIEVPIHRRLWKSGPRIPYRKTYQLRPGQHWLDASQTSDQFENYASLEDGSQIPVGALIAREFIKDGAEYAFFTEMWHGVVFIGPDLICVDPPAVVIDFIRSMKAALGNLRGLPDVMGFFPDGRIRLHEAKNVSAKDRLQPSQHRFANVARSLYGDRVEFGVTEWGFSD